MYRSVTMGEHVVDKVSCNFLSLSLVSGCLQIVQIQEMMQNTTAVKQWNAINVWIKLVLWHKWTSPIGIERE